jgi:transposase
VRVTTAFNRLLQLPGVTVSSVAFTDAGVVVGVRARSRRLRCPCGWSTSAVYDRSRRRWRHLDLGVHNVIVVGEIRRMGCRRCGRVRTEQVQWARPGSRQTIAFEDQVAFLAQRMDRKSISRLMRCAWQTVTDIVARVVAEHLDDGRLDGLVNLGVDEIGYRRGHQYLTVVADHDSGRVVWVGKGKDSAALTRFFDALGPDRRAQVRAVSMDMGRAYNAAVVENIPDAAICLDAFHLIKWTNEALDAVFREHSRGQAARQWRKDRYLLRRAAEKLPGDEHQQLTQLRRKHRQVGRAHELKESLRALFREVQPKDARRYLTRWIAAAQRSRLRPFVLLARRVRAHLEGIIATVRLGLSNSRLEGINAKIRLINARAYGLHSVDSLAAMIYLVLGGITVKLPTET